MELKGKYLLSYTVDKHAEELIVEVELKPVRGILKPYQNLYYGVVEVNGSFYDKKDLSHCVHAVYAAEEIGLELKAELKTKLRKEGKSFRQKKEIISTNESKSD